MEVDIQHIEQGVESILHQTREICEERQEGLTKFAYRTIGEVFGLPNGCKVHIVPAFEESIIITIGASLIALNRSHADPIHENMKWKVSVRRTKNSQAIPYTKGHTITDDAMSRIPLIVKNTASPRIQVAATKLIEAYCSFRTQWKRKQEVEEAAVLVGKDLAGLTPQRSQPVMDNSLPREVVREQPAMPREIDI